MRLPWKFFKDLNRNYTFMEVCGTHTHEISKLGIREKICSSINLLSGPGCPVCVTSERDMEKLIIISKLPDTILVCFGDMLKIPVGNTSLLSEKSQNGNIKVVYSPFDVLEICNNNPQKTIVFAGAGFETTAPLLASLILRAKRNDLKNFKLFPMLKSLFPALKFLASTPQLNIDGFILPGHVSVVTGSKVYDFLSEDYKLSGVITGFDVMQIFSGLKLLCEIVDSGIPKVGNVYKSVVTLKGNVIAGNNIEEVFISCDAEWRGIGIIKDSGFKVNDKYGDFEFNYNFDESDLHLKTNNSCLCGEILLGKIIPPQCPMFNKICTPDNPCGPCMVSSEGTCSAYYLYNLGGF